MAEPLVGQRIGNFRVVRRIGQGATGAVFEAVHEQIGQHVAIKVLRPEAQGAGAQRFLNEARAVSLIRHPGVVYVIEYGALGPEAEGGAAYLVMELLEGESLHERLRARAPLPAPEALRLCRHIAVALAAVHERGIVHRDLKPANVMIVRDSEVPGGERTKIVDFGIAKLRAEDLPEGAGSPVHTLSHAVFGTPAYMAPEQCRGSRHVTDRADVYALGVMLYEMLSASPPFWAPSPPELMYQQIHNQPLPLRELAPTVPQEVADLVQRLLSKEAAARPAMSEVAETLERLSRGPERTGEAPREVPAAPVPQRGAGWRIGLAAAALLGASLLAFSVRQPRDPQGAAGAATRSVVASPPPASPPAAAPPAARWSLRSTPSGAAVIRVKDGARLGQTPWQASAGGESIDVTLRLEGYKDAAPIRLRADQDTDQTVTLRGAAVRRRTPKTPAPLHNEDIEIE